MTVPFVPYHPGTIAVTNGSKNIVGTGTNFTAYQTYDEVHVDGYVLLLDTITDDTHATAKFNHLGTTGSGKAYEWKPTSDLTRALTINQTLYSYLQTGNVSALASLTLAANKGIKATGAGSLATFDLTAAGLALLDDADAAAQRATLGAVIGTNVQAFDAMLQAIAALTSSNGQFMGFSGADTPVMRAIVGTVTQSGGVPTGAIIETGSNGNGQYVKFADGTMICWRVVFHASKAITTAFGNMFITSSPITVTWPVAFVGNPPVVSGGFYDGGGGVCWLAWASSSTTGGSYYFVHPTSATLTVGEVWSAIGKWF